ncbi:MAG: FAD:protein FMN transferase [Acidobacteriota bacterium]|nr:MAG: FAD:protein FMN transferase [Acidobacteriota bacterium]
MKWWRPTLVLLVLLLTIIGIRYFLVRPDPASVPVVVERTLMGTLWQIQVMPRGNDDRAGVEAVIQDAYRELERIDSVMSEWRQDSPITAINLNAGLGPVEVPEELAQIIRRSIEFSNATSGAFDISWRGAGQLYSLDEDFVPPDTEAIAEALKVVDYRRIEVIGSNVGIPGGYSLGLGGIAKGYAIDQAAKVLLDAGYSNLLVNGGGDILAFGTKGDRPWTIGIRAPRGTPEELMAKVRVAGAAVVTSGDYERFQLLDGVRYHHIIDPRTGRPAERTQSVTVIAAEAEKADVLATAFFVLGSQRALELASVYDVDTLIIDSDGKAWMTEGFATQAEFQPEFIEKYSP